MTDQILRRASDLFAEIGSALSAEALLGNARTVAVTDKIREKLTQNLRTSDQLRKIAATGFELCVRALAERGASDVTIHECGTTTPRAVLPMGCTGTLVHDEYTACPVHDQRRSP